LKFQIPSLKETVFRMAASYTPAGVDRWLEPPCLLPYYHMVSDDRVPHVSPLYRFRTVKEFKADLDCLLRGRKAISASDFIDSIQATGLPPRRSCLLSFDDGFREMHDIVAPILKEKGAAAIFFLTSSTVDNPTLCLHQKISLLLDSSEKGHRFPLSEVNQVLVKHGMADLSRASDLAKIPWRQRAAVDELGEICGVDTRRNINRTLHRNK
jgi:hypothetical protein